MTAKHLRVVLGIVVLAKITTGFPNPRPQADFVFPDYDGEYDDADEPEQNQFSNSFQDNRPPNNQVSSDRFPSGLNSIPKRPPPAKQTPRPVSREPPVFPNTGTRPPLCEARCFTTNQYDPVCGDDNVTYNNMGRLDCAVTCGKRVRVLFRGRCSPLLPGAALEQTAA